MEKRIRGDVTGAQWKGLGRKVTREAEKKADFEARTDWWADVVGPCGDCFVNNRGEVVDDIGNFLFRLPADRPGNLVEWVNSNFEEFLEGGE